MPPGSAIIIVLGDGQDASLDEAFSCSKSDALLLLSGSLTLTLPPTPLCVYESLLAATLLFEIQSVLCNILLFPPFLGHLNLFWQVTDVDESLVVYQLELVCSLPCSRGNRDIRLAPLASFLHVITFEETRVIDFFGLAQE